MFTPETQVEEHSGRTAPLRRHRLTPVQQELYLHSLINPGSDLFNVGLSVRLGTGIDPQRWSQAVSVVSREDDASRAFFGNDDAGPYQAAAESCGVCFRFVGPGDLGQFQCAEAFFDVERLVKFDLSKPPLLRHYLVLDPRGEFTAGIMMPHVLLDGLAAAEFFKRVGAVYSAMERREAPVQVDSAPFRDFAEVDCPAFDAPDTKMFWQEKLKHVAHFDFSFHRGADRDQRLALRIDATEAGRIRSFCEQQKCSMPAFFLAMYGILCQRSADMDQDFVIHSILGGRSKRYRNTLGCMYQVLPYQFPKELMYGESPLSGLFKYPGRYLHSIGNARHVSYPLASQILGNPKIKFFYNYLTFGTIDLLGRKCACRTYMSHPHDEVHLLVSDYGDDGIELELLYNERAFPSFRFLERLRSIALQATAPAAAKVGQLDIALPDELDALDSSQGAAGQVTIDRLVQSCFERQAATHADRVALVFNDVSGVACAAPSAADVNRQSLTYRELNARANQLAHHLIKLGVGPGDLVAICLERSVELVVAILGVIKAGGAYVPMDPAYPAERLEFTMQDCAARVLLTQSDLLTLFRNVNCTKVCLDQAHELLKSYDNANPPARSRAEDLAYVIYTSGSTGRPKGVLVTQANLARLFDQTDHWFHFEHRDVWTMFHSASFDFSVWELWGALLYGGRLVVVPRTVTRSPQAFYDLVRSEGVTVLNQTPSAFYQFMQVDETRHDRLSLRYVIFGGEALSLAALRPWVARHGDQRPRLVNMYGITETTVHVTYRPLTADDIRAQSASVIGQPIPDLAIRILDKQLRPRPRGLPGEICVTGAGVANGYLNRPEQTQEHFIPLASPVGAFMYRSGDLARELPDGDIEYLGRIDHQVKIRGFRIELGEIEAALVDHADIRTAAVTCFGESAGDKKLCAYLVPRNGRQPTTSELRDHLSTRLPEHMIPAAFVYLPSMPLTSNGKINRAALPEPDTARPTLAQQYAPPQTPTERQMASIITAVLNVDRVGRDDNFFELGGHSLAATQLAVMTRQLFGVNLPICTVFETPTVAKLSAFIDRSGMKDAGAVPRIPRVRRGGPLPASFAQARVWFLLHLYPDNRAYEFQATLRFDGPLDVPLLTRCLTDIVARHEVYRTTFDEVDGQVCQFIHEPMPVDLPVLDLTRLPMEKREAEAQRLIRAAADKVIRMDELPLVRWTLLKLREDQHVLVHFEHHIIHDGWSFVLFLRELLELYKAYAAGLPSPLPELPIQFADYAAWHREWADSKEAEAQIAYWKNKLAGAPALLELPLDHPRPAQQRFEGDALRLDLPIELSEKLDAFCRSVGATPYMALLTAFLATLHRYSGQEDIVVGTGIANRRSRETENLFGMLINNIALRNDLSGDPTFIELLGRVRQTALEAYDRQDVPFERVVEAVNPPRSTSYTPIFQAIFTSFDGQIPDLGLPGVSIRMNEGLNNGTAKFDLNIVIIARQKSEMGPKEAANAKTITLIWEFNTSIYSRAFMRGMFESFQTTLRNGIAKPQKRITELSLISEPARSQVLGDFNPSWPAYPAKAVHELFEEQALRRGDAIALSMGGDRLSYAELNRRANRLARHLRDSGVSRGDMVGLLAERSFDMVVGTLAILKAGGVYVPLDPTYPTARLAFMLRDIARGMTPGANGKRRKPILLTQNHLLDRPGPSEAEQDDPQAMPLTDMTIVRMDADHASIARQPSDNLALPASPLDPAYVIYTSGSTGVPKGTIIPHRGVVRLVRNTNYVTISENDVFLQLAPFSFDASTFELWGSLLNGARLAIFPAHTPSLEELGRTIASEKVSTLWLTSALFSQMVDSELDSLRNVRQLLAGGDVLSVPHVQRYVATLTGDRRLINGYGPTENTTFTCCHVMGPGATIGRTVPIGRPIAHTRVYILDRHDEPVPVGMPGHLHIAGDGLAAGYLHQPELTAERFVPDPFAKDAGAAARMYRTGDLARWLPDGTIEFLGRNDQQLKLRGYRIEPGEIEHALVQQPGVAQAAVVLREDDSTDRRLVAYIVPTAGTSFDEEALRRSLLQRLPTYMIPAAFVAIDQLPLSPNGKLDRARLPAPQRIVRGNVSHAATSQPRTDTERKLAAMWRELLKIDEVGRDENFFQIGGHSLLATQLVSRVRQAMHVELPLAAIFECPTIESLARQLDAMSFALHHPRRDLVGSTNREEGEV